MAASRFLGPGASDPHGRPAQRRSGQEEKGQCHESLWRRGGRAVPPGWAERGLRGASRDRPRPCDRRQRRLGRLRGLPQGPAAVLPQRQSAERDGLRRVQDGGRGAVPPGPGYLRVRTLRTGGLGRRLSLLPAHDSDGSILRFQGAEDQRGRRGRRPCDPGLFCLAASLVREEKREFRRQHSAGSDQRIPAARARWRPQRLRHVHLQPVAVQLLLLQGARSAELLWRRGFCARGFSP